MLEEKTLDLMTLLTAYTEENSPAVPVILRPPTPVPLSLPLLRLPRRREKEGSTWGRRALKREKYYQPPNKNLLKSLDLQGFSRRRALSRG